MNLPGRYHDRSTMGKIVGVVKAIPEESHMIAVNEKSQSGPLFSLPSCIDYLLDTLADEYPKSAENPFLFSLSASGQVAMKYLIVLDPMPRSAYDKILKNEPETVAQN